MHILNIVFAIYLMNNLEAEKSSDNFVRLFLLYLTKNLRQLDFLLESEGWALNKVINYLDSVFG